LSGKASLFQTKRFDLHSHIFPLDKEKRYSQADYATVEYGIFCSTRFLVSILKTSS
jgi:hypothetical protein